MAQQRLQVISHSSWINLWEGASYYAKREWPVICRSEEKFDARRTPTPYLNNKSEWIGMNRKSYRLRSIFALKHRHKNHPKEVGQTKPRSPSWTPLRDGQNYSHVPTFSLNEAKKSGRHTTGGPLEPVYQLVMFRDLRPYYTAHNNT